MQVKPLLPSRRTIILPCAPAVGKPPTQPPSHRPTHCSSEVLRRDVKLIGGVSFVLAETHVQPRMGSITQMFQTHMLT